MRLQLLGTAGGDFRRVDDLEDGFGHLPRVRELGGRNLRRPAQAVIFPDVLIDYHDGNQLEKFGIAPQSIRHLFLTHNHWDHFRPTRILEFADALPHQLQVYGEHGVIEALKFADTYHLDRGTGRFTVRESRSNIGYHKLVPHRKCTVGDTAVTAVHANHNIDKSENMIMDNLSLNYVFERDGKTIFYGLDSSYPLPLTVDYLRRFRVDVAIMDATFGRKPIDVVLSGHLNFDMLGETIRQFREAGIFHKETRVIASHISLAFVEPHDDLEGEVAELGFALGFDGMELEM
ncbi:MAG: MBL fold metallo-hydrolase [Opitutaceae bacterium]